MSLLEDESFPEDELLEQINHFDNHPNIDEGNEKSSNILPAHDDDASFRPPSKRYNRKHVNDHADSVNIEKLPTQHAEYVKRHFGHVESKVGQYIASMMAEDKKRRAIRSMRYQSMPDIFNRANASNAAILRTYDTATNTEGNPPQNHAKMASLSSSVGLKIPGGVADRELYESFLNDKQRMQAYTDHLESQLDKKKGDIVRLKRNVDFLRIELSNCQDKLKQQNAQLKTIPANRFSAGGYFPKKTSKAIQTEIKSPSPSPQEISKPQTNSDSHAGSLAQILQHSSHPQPQPQSQPQSSQYSVYINKNILGHANASGEGHNRNVATIQPLSLNSTNSRLIDDKQRMQSNIDHLQTQLDIKEADNVRLKRQLDFQRIELGKYQEKLKQQTAGTEQSLAGQSGVGGYWPTKTSKALQTDIKSPLSTPQKKSKSQPNPRKIRYTSSSLYRNILQSQDPLRTDGNDVMPDSPHNKNSLFGSPKCGDCKHKARYSNSVSTAGILRDRTNLSFRRQ